MKIQKNKLNAVITGDVIRSSKLSAARRKKLVSDLRKASKMLRRYYGEFVPLPVDVFRGDSWQMIVSEPPQVLKIALYFRAVLKNLWRRVNSILGWQ